MKQQIEISKPTYGLLTSITMIVGIVVGSGVYFKADDILFFTGGSLSLGIIILLLGALNILFGSLTLSQLSKKNTDSGGLMSFYSQYYSDRLAFVVGMFQMVIYIPIITAIVAWVSTNYISVLLGTSFSFEVEILLAAMIVGMIALVNLFSKKIAGYFQNLSTMVKLIPLVVIILVGIYVSMTTTEIVSSSETIQRQSIGLGWLAGLVPLAFTYDGWTVVSNIAPEIKNAKRNLPLAYLFGSVSIVLLYVLYFYGLVSILGESAIMTLGNDSIYHAISLLFGNHFAKFMVLIVVISVLGVVNGLFLANARLPQSYAQRGWISSQEVSQINPKYGISIPSIGIAFGITLFWLIIHYFLVKTNALPNTDISESAVVFNQLCLLPLYVVVFKQFLSKTITNRFLGMISPLLAILGILILIIGNFFLNVKGALFTTFFGMISIAFFYHLAKKKL